MLTLMLLTVCGEAGVGVSFGAGVRLSPLKAAAALRCSSATAAGSALADSSQPQGGGGA